MLPIADLVLMLHFGVVVFIVGGPPAVVLGNRLGWRWVNSPRFRFLHLAAIAVVVAESWFGIDCPLTTLEVGLRAQTDGTGVAQGFVAHWVQRVLFYTAPPWVFTLAYSGYGLLVAALWWYFPPRTHRPGKAGAAGRPGSRDG